MPRVRVPLAVDAQIRIPVGPVLLPMRSLALIAVATPGAVGELQISALSVSARLSIAMVTLMLAFTASAPTREGIWIGTWLLYAAASRRLLATVVIDGVPRRASVARVGQGLRIDRVRAPSRWNRSRSLARICGLRSVTIVGDGVLRVGNHHAGLLAFEPHCGTPGSADHAAWCSRFVDWLYTLECPVQLLTICDHFDGVRARAAFDQRVGSWPRTPLLERERELAHRVAEQSLGLRHFVVLLPGQAGRDGLIGGSWLRPVSPSSPVKAAETVAEAMRSAAAAGIGVRAADDDEASGLVLGSAHGLRNAAIGGGVLHVGDHQHQVVAVVKLPPTIVHGAVVDALIRSRTRAVVSLHFAPVESEVARRTLDRRLALRQYASRESRKGTVEADVDMADTAHMLASLAQRSLRPCRIALTIAVSACTAAEREEAVARMESALRLQGLLTTVPSLPGFLPFTAAAPAGVPLRRSIHMTTDAVASCMLPALATPLDDCRHPLLGLAEATEAPAYLSVWECPNHNAIVLGTSGSGKSVAVKTMLARHVMSGAAAVVLDPDSEYRRLMAALGGTHIELGADALNPLGPGTALAPDEAAGLVLPVLSLMSGDERGVRDGRPIRRLPDEDQGWLYDQLADFYRSWGGTNPRVEPVLSDLLSHMRRCSDAAGHSDQQRERARVIRARLARYVQGDRSSLFDRRSTFSVGERPTAIGFRSVAMAYASDLTPALAVVLSALLARLRNGASRLLVVVDEAHRVTSDPDAGEVLGQLVRQARKYGAGVWMCSQRIDDFVATDLGRTLASTAATKLVMGVEEAALSDVRAVFSLRDEEVAAVHPALPGRGVLISGGQRCVVRILPGAAVLAVASSSPVFAALH